MKITDNLVKRFGADKLLHLSFGGWISALTLCCNWVVLLVITILLNIISFYKEYRLDSKAEIYDILACNIGIFITWLVYIISCLIV